jgi:hypothetical protein
MVVIQEKPKEISSWQKRQNPRKRRLVVRTAAYGVAVNVVSSGGSVCISVDSAFERSRQSWGSKNIHKLNINKSLQI